MPGSTSLTHRYRILEKPALCSICGASKLRIVGNISRVIFDLKFYGPWYQAMGHTVLLQEMPMRFSSAFSGSGHPAHLPRGPERRLGLVEAASSARPSGRRPFAEPAAATRFDKPRPEAQCPAPRADHRPDWDGCIERITRLDALPDVRTGSRPEMLIRSISCCFFLGEQTQERTCPLASSVPLLQTRNCDVLDGQIIVGSIAECIRGLAFLAGIL
jgi:hypothetical protein